MTTPKKKKKLSIALDCMIDCTNSTTLVTLESMESLKTYLSYHTARIRNHQRILEVSKDHDGKGIPFVQYHRNCWSVFNMKRDLEKIEKSKVRVLLGHTVLHNSPTVLHDVNT